MRRAVSVALLALLVSPAAFGVTRAPRDTARPSVRYVTRSGDMLLSNASGLSSDVVPLEVRGTASDSGTGVRAVVVSWLKCTTASDSACAVMGPDTMLSSHQTATLACSSDNHRSCAWRSPTPTAPGFYWVTARATDRVGNVSRGEGILHLTVA